MYNYGKTNRNFVEVIITMIVHSKIIKDKKGREIILRNAVEDDAEKLIDHLKITAAETPFLIREPDEITLSIKQE